MIRKVVPEDAAAIASIYNEYILHSVITFDTAPVSESDMRSSILDISARFPYFVYEDKGKVVGFCYAHPWKGKAAYRHTLETTLYLMPDVKGRGLGTQLMERLMAECRAGGYKVLIACITEGNTVSESFHRKLGFTKVSHFTKVGFKFNRLLDVVDYELVL